MEGKSLWIQVGDVHGRIEPGNIVTAAHPLSDWCLRADDGSEPVQPGTPLEVVDVRPWSAAQAVETVSEDETDAATECAGLAPDRAAQIKRMARLEKLIAADEWGAYQELRALGSPAARELRELVEGVQEAVQVHLDLRERLLYVSIDGWTRREWVSWAETAAEHPVSGPPVGPLPPDAILAGAAS